MQKRANSVEGNKYTKTQRKNQGTPRWEPGPRIRVNPKKKEEVECFKMEARTKDGGLMNQAGDQVAMEAGSDDDVSDQEAGGCKGLIKED